MRVSGLSQTDACDVIATDYVLNARCNLQNLETIPDSMHNHVSMNSDLHFYKSYDCFWYICHHNVQQR